jgi:hypothetical protein
MIGTIPEVPYVRLDWMDGRYFIQQIISHTEYDVLTQDHKRLYVRLPANVLEGYQTHLRADAVFQHMFSLMEREKEHQSMRTTLFEMERDLIPPDKWTEHIPLMPEEGRIYIEDDPVGLGLGRNGICGWFILFSSGQGPGLVWAQFPDRIDFPPGGSQ